jgi:hypothetical protein
MDQLHSDKGLEQSEGKKFQQAGRLKDLPKNGPSTKDVT